jgi:hypothetical protein
MSTLLRTILALSVTGLLVVGCGKKEEAPAETAPVVAPVEAPAASPTAAVEAPSNEPGGYVPTAEERVPGITIDASAQPVTEETPAASATTEAAPATEAAK